MNTTPNIVEATIIVRALSEHSGAKPDALVTCLAITDAGEWVRLYPITVPKGKVANDFKRWDRVRFSWLASKDDARPESRKVDMQTVALIGELAAEKRQELLDKLTISNMYDATQKGYTLVLLRPRKVMFAVRKKNPVEVGEEKRMQDALAKVSLPGKLDRAVEKIYPYSFTYKIWSDDTEFDAAYLGWEMRETFHNLASSLGDPQALSRVIQIWGKEYVAKGLYLVLSRNPAIRGEWVIAGVISREELESAANMFNLIA